ncbi:MAG: fumarylacetoacetate hydrolase family protein [Bacteroidetes bacterium]|nr:fumarylacetoacetate hydrolase family protein [Bacteroidota bacterium]
MKIICIGRNYVEHIKELNNVIPTSPVFFLKPDTALLIRNRPFYYPSFSNAIHYEVELVLKICKVGKNIQKQFASRYFDEIGIGLDMTARDLQDEAKSKGLPWAVAKGFDQSAPVSKFLMMYDFDEIISSISNFMTIRTGDYIFTGTPAGVGPVKIGDKLEAYLEGDKLLSCLIK